MSKIINRHTSCFFAPLQPQPSSPEPELAQPEIFSAVYEQLGLKLRPAR
jgi:hypothetical protein